MNCSREKCLSLFSEYINFSFCTKILSPLKCSKKSESKIDSHSCIQRLAFHELLPPLGESFLTNISYQDTWHFLTACMSHNTDTSILKINGCWTMNKTCLFHLNLKYVHVHLLPLRVFLDCLWITLLSLKQSRLKNDGPRIYLGEHLSMKGKNRGKGTIFCTDIFPGLQDTFIRLHF